MKKGQGLVVHTHDCPTAAKSRGDPEKWLDVEWAPKTDKMFDVGIRVTVVNDDLREPNEAFFVALFNPINATISADRGVGIGKITNQDLPYQTPECAEEFPLPFIVDNNPATEDEPMKPTGGMRLNSSMC